MSGPPLFGESLQPVDCDSDDRLGRPYKNFPPCGPGFFLVLVFFRLLSQDKPVLLSRIFLFTECRVSPERARFSQFVAGGSGAKVFFSQLCLEPSQGFSSRESRQVCRSPFPGGGFMVGKGPLSFLLLAIQGDRPPSSRSSPLPLAGAVALPSSFRRLGVDAQEFRSFVPCIFFPLPFKAVFCIT